MLSKEEVKANLYSIQENIDKVASKKITLVAVTKTLPAEVYDLCFELGLTHIGENRVQELKSKIEEKSSLRDKFQFHLIGHLQSNKVKFLYDMADSLDTLDSADTLKKIEQIYAGKNLDKLSVLLQINAASEANKAGISIENTYEIENITSLCLKSSAVEMQGLFAIGPTPFNLSDLEFEKQTKNTFRKTRELKENLENKFNVKFNRLSMGMSSDYIWALEEGATEIRLGSILFGSRL
ncbi:MAG: YggS family pyridoxal phosphate-dependent enzyme [Spirochaetia bacterium]|nr:YggS family pyridoxal phosphate-dependent enzyme [Spirochaetia bacterium]